MRATGLVAIGRRNVGNIREVRLIYKQQSPGIFVGVLLFKEPQSVLSAAQAEKPGDERTVKTGHYSFPQIRA